jgi:hypothetical protein
VSEIIEIVASRLELDVEVRIETREIDRSVAEFVVHDEHHALARLMVRRT